MKWIQHFQLFLFDFDGLLVNTENLHFQAYQTMCLSHGCQLDWNFETFCKYAHFDAHALKNALYEKFPPLRQFTWDRLYQEKKEAYVQHLQESEKILMPGVEKLLLALDHHKIKRCVVTHSVKDHVDLIRAKNPLLNTIPYWITRDDYTLPKPDPECYLKAIEKYGSKQEKMIGFEDSLRGLRALQGTYATSVLISSFIQHNLSEYCSRPFYHFSSFEEIGESFSG